MAERSLKKRIINNLEEETFARLMPSKIHGIGVVAIRQIPADTDPFKLTCPRKERVVTLSDEDIRFMPEEVKKLLTDFVGSDQKRHSIGYDVPDYGMNGIDISFYLNHSDSPNLKMVPLTHSAYIGFRTKHVILSHEELTIDYNEYEKE